MMSDMEYFIRQVIQKEKEDREKEPANPMDYMANHSSMEMKSTGGTAYDR